MHYANSLDKKFVVAKISHRAGADRDSKPGSLNTVELQLLSAEPQQLARISSECTIFYIYLEIG